MAKRGGGMPGGMNMNSLLKQAQKMQKQMEETQAALEEKTLDVTAGGGAIKATINGKKEFTSIEINEEVVDPDDIEMLQDLILSATNEAIRQMDELVNQEMGKVTGGGMPGMPGGMF